VNIWIATFFFQLFFSALALCYFAKSLRPLRLNLAFFFYRKVREGIRKDRQVGVLIV